MSRKPTPKVESRPPIKGLEIAGFSNISFLLANWPEADLALFVASVVYAWVKISSGASPGMIPEPLSEATITRFELFLSEHYTPASGSQLRLQVGALNHEHYRMAQLVINPERPKEVMTFMATDEALTCLVGLLAYHNLITLDFDCCTSFKTVASL